MDEERIQQTSSLEFTTISVVGDAGVSEGSVGVMNA